jgi:hypothetical protein
MSIGEAAAQLGVPVFPCNADKKPVNDNGWKGASDNPDRIRQEFARPSAAAIGMPTGAPSGYIAIDIDVKQPGANGNDWLDEHAYDLPPTRAHNTRSGGLHLIFKAPPNVEIRNSAGRLAPGVDVRGDGGYIIVPPSPGYAVADDIAPAEMPEWLIKACQKRPEPPQPPPGQRAQSNGSDNRYAEAALIGECRAVATAPDGTRNDTLNVAAVKLGGFVGAGLLTANTVIQKLTQAAMTAGLDPREIKATIQSGLGYGLLHPREVPERQVPPTLDQVGPRLDQVTPSADAPTDPEDLAEAFDPSDLDDIPPRQWVYGHFLIREFISVLGAPGGTGKSAYAVVIALSIALGRPLLNEPVHKRGKVWIYNLEDPKVELKRRLKAAILHHKIDPKDLKDWLYYNSGRDRPLVIARVHNGQLVVEPIVDKVIAEINRKQVETFIVDPFIRSHRLEENKNDHVDFVAALWAYIAAVTGCTILLVHHFRKGGVSGQADAFRGASALIDASRAAISVATMDEKEAGVLGVEGKQRRFYIRADNAKLNLAPPPDETTWLKLCNVALPNGDCVQAVERWEPPSPWDGIPWEMVADILEKIDAGPEAGEHFYAGKQSGDRWAGQVIMDIAGKTEKQAATILETWRSNGALEDYDYHSKRKRKNVTGLRVNTIKLAEMKQAITSEVFDD